MAILRMHPVGNAALQRWFVRTVLALLVGVLLPLLSPQSSYAHLDITLPDLSFHPYHFKNNTPGNGNDTGPINLIFIADKDTTLEHYRHHIPGAREKFGTVFQFEDHGVKGDQDAQLMEGSFYNQLHLRFKQGFDADPILGLYTLASSHRDKTTIFCFPLHKGTEFDETRDLVLDAFREGGHSVNLTDLQNTDSLEQCSGSTAGNGLLVEIFLDDTIYASSFSSGQIFKVNTRTGAKTEIADFGFTTEDMVVDLNGILYIGGGTTGVKRIDTVTETVLSDVGTNICGPEGGSVDLLNPAAKDIYFNTRQSPCAHSGVWKISGGTAVTAVQVMPPHSGFGEGTGFLRGPSAPGPLLSVDRSGGRIMRSSRPDLASNNPPTPFITGLNTPLGLAMDSQGRVYVSEIFTGLIKRFDSSGTFLDNFASGLSQPVFLEFDSADFLYVAEFAGDRLTKIAPDGTKTVLTTINDIVGLAIAPPSASPRSVRVTGGSPVNILVTDPGLYRVGFDPFTGATVIGIPGATYTGPGTEPQVITIPDLVPGEYGLTLIGTGTGAFEITVEVLSENGTVLSSRVVSGTVTAGDHRWSAFHIGDDDEFNPLVVLTDSTLPSCSSVVTLPDTIQLTLQDTASGLSAINIITADNVDGAISTFNVGANDPLVLTLTRDDPSAAAEIQLQVADVAGNISSCGAVLEAVQITVQIDVKPGSDPNCINLGSEGFIPVAVLTTATFDAADVDQSSLTLEGAVAREKGKSGNIGSFEDVDGDGDLDLVVQFPTADLGLTEADTEAILDGLTTGGTPIQGVDSICVVP